MEKVIVSFENCYGIRKLDYEFDFSKKTAYAIYAPNGVMKTSFANVFDDISNDKKPSDRANPELEAIYTILDQNNLNINQDSILVVKPYVKDYSSKKTSSLMVNEDLRREYEDCVSEIQDKADNLLTSLAAKANLRSDIDNELKDTFGKELGKDLFGILAGLNKIVEDEMNPELSWINYRDIFNSKVSKFLEKSTVRKQIGEYVQRYNELLDQSLYFRRGVFNHTNAKSIEKALKDNGFFEAHHKIALADRYSVHKEITTPEKLREAIESEKKKILQDPELLSRFEDIDKEITRNVELRKFRDCLEQNPEIISELTDLNKLRRKVWISYSKDIHDLFFDFAEVYKKAKNRILEITSVARKQETEWKNILKIFHERFFVPFELEVKNTENVILKDETPNLIFKFCDHCNNREVKRELLLDILSMGELRALYLLNVIFEIRARSKDSQKTLLIIDDISDSFDYKNKYAILQYLKDILDEEKYLMIILTHNFDFYRVTCSRLGIDRSHSLMATRDEVGSVFLQKAEYLRPFRYWRNKCSSDKRIIFAIIPMVRNLVEYTRGCEDNNYIFTTSLLHFKSNTRDISLDDLVSIINKELGTEVEGGIVKYFESIMEEADKCLADKNEIKLENKVVLSIAIRLLAEKFMIERIDNPSLTESIDNNQTYALYEKFKSIKPKDNEIKLIEKVILITPETIHLNSFMYEPILDMSHYTLCKLYEEVKHIQ